MAFPLTPVLDNFTGTNGDDLPVYSANWDATPTGGTALEIQSNAATGTSAGGNNSNSWGTTFGPDCEVYVTVSTAAAAGNVILLLARGVQTTSLATIDGYALRYAPAAGTDTLTIQSVTNGAQTSIGAAFSQEIANGDSIGLECVGTTLTCYYKPSGGSWSALFSRTDSTYSSAGKIGLLSSSTGVRLDAFGGGTIHQSTGALTGQGSVVTGSATRFRAHSSSGALVGQGSVLSGTATRFRAHASSGSLIGQGSVIAGTATRSTSSNTHDASGSLVGQGSVVSGTALRFIAHTSSGTLIGQGSVVSGTALHNTTHASTGSLVGQGSEVVGTATRIPAPVTHTSSGVLVGQGSVISGNAQNGIITTPTPQFGGGLSSSRAKRYYIERDGKRIFFTDESQVYDLLHQEEKRVVKKAKKAIKRVTKAELAELVTFKDLEIPTPKIVMHFNDVAINNSIDKINQRIYDNYVKALMRHVEEMEEEEIFLELLFH